MFKLSLRELFLIVAVFGLGLGWWLNAKEMNRRERFYRGLAGFYGNHLRALGYEMDSYDDFVTLEIPKEFWGRPGIGIERWGWWFQGNPSPDESSVMAVPDA